MPAPGDLVSEKYRIVSEIGAGGMGVVFAAVHVDTERKVALKWLSPALLHVPEAAARFQREARATGRIHHPNVVAVHDCSAHDGQLYLVMEHLVGGTLRSALRAAGGKLAPDAAFRVLFPVMRGVAAAHAAGVLHRDLKPENILLCESPDGLECVPKVLDFGLAKLRDHDQRTQLTAPASLMGTYAYMAPEQLRARDEIDERVDVYALGVMLYELLTGALPYAADNPVDLALQVLTSEPPLLSAHDATLPPALAQVVARALAREPAERFESIEALARALGPLAGNLTLRGDRAEMARSNGVAPAPSIDVAEASSAPRSSQAAPTRPPHARARGRSRALVAAVLGALALIAGGLVTALRAPASVARAPEPRPAAIAAPRESITDAVAHDWQLTPPRAPAPHAPVAPSASRDDGLEPATVPEPDASITPSGDPDASVRAARRPHAGKSETRSSGPRPRSLDRRMTADQF